MKSIVRVPKNDLKQVPKMCLIETKSHKLWKRVFTDVQELHKKYINNHGEKHNTQLRIKCISVVLAAVAGLK